MGSSPKKQGPSASEQASASVAMAEYNRFKQKYDPLLQQMRDQSLTADVQTTLRGRANADTMQALTSAPTYQSTLSNTATGEAAQALQGQLGQATQRGANIQNTAQTNVLGIARGQAADAQSGMAQASRLATSEALARAKASQAAANARLGAATQLGTTFLLQGAENMKSGGSFLTPNDKDGSPVKSLADRLKYSGVA